MAQGSISQRLTLSRFFQKNIDTIKNKNLIEDFETLTNFSTIADEWKNVKIRKKAKRKMLGPQFKGFSSEDRKQSKTEKDQMDLIAVEKKDVEKRNKIRRKKIGPQFKGFSNEDRKQATTDKDQMVLLISRIKESIEEPKIFCGFSKEEIDCSNELCDKKRNQVESFEINTFKLFRGFSKQDQNDSISKLSYILEKCVSIRADIYKNIDRRILTYHLKEEKTQEKMVCSKYWAKPENFVGLEDVEQIKKNGIKSCNSKFFNMNSFKMSRNLRKKDGIKMEKIKTDLNGLKEENDFISEIHKLQKEIKALRTNSLSPTKDIKLQDAPFIQIKKELIMSPFVPPKSPHNLIEEDLYHDPWALLVATIFLNKTSGRTARPYVFWFLDENPDPLIVLGKRVEQLETYFGALGLQKTRASQVWRMSHDFIYKKWQKVSELYGIGRYGEDAFRMFCLGDFSIEPKDRYLRIYKAWYEMQDRKARFKEMNS